MQGSLKLLEIETHRRQTLKKVKEKQIMRETSNKYFFNCNKYFK